MTIHLTPQQRQALQRGEPVRIPAAEAGRDVIMIDAQRFEQMSSGLEDAQEQQVFRDFARRQAASLAVEYPY